MGRTLVQRVHNPRNLQCACSPGCWCRTTVLGRAFRWWFPAHWFGIRHRPQWTDVQKRRFVEMR